MAKVVGLHLINVVQFPVFIPPSNGYKNCPRQNTMKRDADVSAPTLSPSLRPVPGSPLVS